MKPISRKWVEEIFRCFKEEDLGGAITIRNQHIPSKLYKYQRFKRENEPADQDRLVDVTQGMARFSKPSSFNDPYDCLISMERQSEYGQRLNDDLLFNSNAGRALKEKYGEEKLYLLHEAMKKSYDETTIRVLEHINHRSRNNLQILCLSESFDNILLWSHYGNHHTGYCIEYAVNPGEHTFWPVFYREGVFDYLELIKSCDSYEKYISRYIDKDGNLVKRDLTQPSKPDANSLTPLVCALVKAPDWEYEREWRCTTLAYPDQEAFMPIPITALYVGSEAKETDIHRLISVVTKAKIPLYQMKMDMAHFKLSPFVLYSPYNTVPTT